jgi:hypothetical protein
MDFSSPVQVCDVIETMKTADILRACNRVLIQDLMNGVPPYTDQEVEDNHILVNCNWKEGTNLIHQSRRQYENAFLKPGYYFKVHLESGRVSKRPEWSRTITREINKPLKRSLSFMEAYRSKFAGVVLHGVGPMAWEDKWAWEPYTFGIEDLLIPTDTYTTLSNLYYFAIRRPMKPGELYRKTFRKGKNMDRGWNPKYVEEILASMKPVNNNPNNWNWSEHPEKLAEIYKQNSTYYDADSSPTIYFWDFYYQNEESSAWNRRMVLDRNNTTGSLPTLSSAPDYIYEKDNFANNLNEIMHMQIGDGNNKPPFMYHSIRSVGWILYDVVSMMNRVRCQFTEHVFEQMMMLFRVTDPNDRSRLEKILLSNKGIIPEGAAIVPAGDRYTVDSNLVEQLIGSYKQLMVESTAANRQEYGDQQNQEKTATQVMAEVNSVNALTTSLITYAYLREDFAYREICRRFCIANSPEPSVQKFRRACMDEGVPEELLDVDKWQVESVRVLGGGNKVLEVAEAKELQALRPQLDPDAQREIDRITIGAITDDEKLALHLVPENAKQMPNESEHDAELAFGTLMQGVPMRVRSGLNNRDQVETLLKLLGMSVQRVMQTDHMGTPQQLLGFQMVAQYISQHLQLMAQDKREKQRVRQYADVLKRIMNEVKGMAQRQQQAAQQQAPPDPREMAKLQSAAQMHQIKLQGKQQQDQQKLQHKQLSFRQDQQHKEMQTRAEIQRKNALTAAELRNKAMHGVIDAHGAALQSMRATEDE